MLSNEIDTQRSIISFEENLNFQRIEKSSNSLINMIQ